MAHSTPLSCLWSPAASILAPAVAFRPCSDCRTQHAAPAHGDTCRVAAALRFPAPHPSRRLCTAFRPVASGHALHLAAALAVTCSSQPLLAVPSRPRAVGCASHPARAHRGAVVHRRPRRWPRPHTANQAQPPPAPVVLPCTLPSPSGSAAHPAYEPVSTRCISLSPQWHASPLIFATVVVHQIPPPRWRPRTAPLSRASGHPQHPAPTQRSQPASLHADGRASLPPLMHRVTRQRRQPHTAPRPSADDCTQALLQLSCQCRCSRTSTD